MFSHSEIQKTWREKGKKLEVPEILTARYMEKSYYVLRDSSVVIFIIPENCSSTFAIVKKYCTISEDNEKNKFYKIENLENLTIVSCPSNKSPYEKFIIDNFISK